MHAWERNDRVRIGGGTGRVESGPHKINGITGETGYLVEREDGCYRLYPGSALFPLPIQVGDLVILKGQLAWKRTVHYLDDELVVLKRVKESQLGDLYKAMPLDEFERYWTRWHPPAAEEG